jgi:hypothetical protein
MKSLRWGLVVVAMVAAGAGTLAEIGSEGERKQLIDVAEAQLFDGWGLAAVETLSMYYGADGTRADVQMLGYRGSFFPVFDWANGAIAAGGDLYAFYASGAGAARVQDPSDPAYAFSYGVRYPEPAGRAETASGAGLALSMAAAQTSLDGAPRQ